MFRKDIATFELKQEPKLIKFFERAEEISTSFKTALYKLLGRIGADKDGFMSKLFAYPFDVDRDLRGIDYDPSVFLILNPDLLLRALPPVLYHVTGESSAIAIMNGRNLYPPKFHTQLQILPDKGATAVETRVFLFELFDICSYNYPSFLFSGAQIDSEQIDLQNNLPKNQNELQTRIAEIFVEMDLNSLVIKPKAWLFDHLANIYSGRKIEIDESLEFKINNFLAEINRLLFLREGWFTKIKAIMFGEVKIEHKDVSEIFYKYIHLFRNRSHTENREIRKSTILEINTSKMIESSLLSFMGMDILPFLVSPRPIGTIVPTAIIPACAVQNIYYDQSDLAKSSYFDLPHTNYIAGKYPSGTIEFYNADSPACSIRYQSETDWKTLFLSGEILPSLIYSGTSKIRIFGRPFGISNVHHIISLGGYGIFDTTEAEYNRLGSELSMAHSEAGVFNPNVNYIDAKLRNVYPTVEGFM